MLKRGIYKLYYTLQFGGACYAWMRVFDKLLGRDKAKKYLYRKSKEVSPEKYSEELIKIYGAMTGNKLDLNNPYTFNEKIQWMKLYDTTPLKTRLADKYLVREWIKEKIGEQYLIPLLGAWDTFREINISDLPDSFVLKMNHGSTWNVVVKEKERMNWEEVQERFDYWTTIDYAFIIGFEMQYLNIQPKIVAEQYIGDTNGSLLDYKIHCFHGNPEYIHVIGDRDPDKHRAKEAFYNTEWILQPFSSGVYPRYIKEKQKPVNLDEMLRVARILSKDFPYVRVDLYELSSGDIKFGEMTFTPGSGFYHWIPSRMDRELGEKICLPSKEEHNRYDSSR